MKKLLFLVLILVSISLPKTYAQVSYGGGMSLILDEVNSFGFQARTNYEIIENWRVAADVNYYLKDNFTFWSFDINAQYHLTTLGDKVDFSPIAGYNHSRITVFDFSRGRNFFNLGGLFELPLFTLGNRTPRVYAEPKFLIGESTSFVLSAGVVF